ncbi:hypothetical protein FFZ77_23090 [Streptomyces katsurahamanus]|uniref:Uncharacterized protein n=1 Tax=Streptomyces katsurahamanus TaxID=2577098 RepID=A0ABW9NYN6_9ACTN|nr:hypothetical protein [Streptomyces katsurahamanus]
MPGDREERCAYAGHAAVIAYAMYAAYAAVIPYATYAAVIAYGERHAFTSPAPPSHTRRPERPLP